MVRRTKKIWFLISLLLLLLTSGVEGWIYGLWVNRFLKQELLTQFAESTRLSILYGAAFVGILLLVFLFTSPISLLTVGLNGWLGSDSRAFLSIFVGAFAFAILVQRVDYVARFLVFVAAIFLVKLDLQLLGYSRWLCSVVLAILCWFGFTGGILTFYVGFQT
jgi:hypothetical protein